MKLVKIFASNYRVQDKVEKNKVFESKGTKGQNVKSKIAAATSTSASIEF